MMNKNLVKINIHGVIGKKLGKKTWKLSVSSVQEALHAINTMTNSKFRIVMNSLARKGIKFSVRVNNNTISHNGDEESSPLGVNYENLRTIDVAPVVEGAGGLFSALDLGGDLGTMFAGAAIFGLSGGNSTMQIIGANLFFAGLANALSEPPEGPEDRQITNPSSDPQALANSYLFNGPVNIINEGGPVPIGYGRLMVGSQVIMSHYGVERKRVDQAGRVI
jgi:predicted phage tail protein